MVDTHCHCSPSIVSHVDARNDPMTTDVVTSEKGRVSSVPGRTRLAPLATGSRRGLVDWGRKPAAPIPIA